MTTTQRNAALARFWRALEEDTPLGDVSGLSSTPVPLSSRLAVADLAWASVTTAALSASLLTRSPAQALTDPLQIALAYNSDRHLRIDDKEVDVWSPLSGFWRTSDGWVRTHGNYPHHARALVQALKLTPDATPDALTHALSDLSSAEAAGLITAAGGLCVVVRKENPDIDQELRKQPVVEITHVRDGSPPRSLDATVEAPLRGIRVLDLTRVIAGPVATRTLALLGAEVLRIDPPHIDEMAWQHLDTGHGKRSARLDIAAESGLWLQLLDKADVVVLGYRAEGLTRLGLDVSTLLAQRPGLVVAQLTAWGAEEPKRRGFDSLVQAESGISWIESVDGVRPGALPAQALDHSAGYLLAAGICTALRRRADEGGSWVVGTSLRRIAAELLGMPRSEEPAAAVASTPRTDQLQTFDVAGVKVTTVAPAVRWPGGPTQFATPLPWGEAIATWS